MELSSLPFSAFRVLDTVYRQKLIASPRYVAKDLSSKRSPMATSRIAFSSPRSCSKSLTNGTLLLRTNRVHQATTEPTVEKKKDILWRFLRPLTTITLLLEFVSIFARRLVENPHIFRSSNWPILTKIPLAFASLMFTYFFTISVNQITDIETDKINKPHLPLASGGLSIESAWALAIGSVAFSLFAAGVLESLSFVTSVFSLLLVAIVYAIPPFRTKASTIGAPVTISLMRGFVDIFAIFAGVGAALGLPFRMSLAMIYMSIFTTIFGFSMGILKDISDMEGDKKSNIPTLANIIGAKNALRLGTGIHMLNHFGCILGAILRPEALKGSIIIPTHVISAFFIIHQAWKIEQTNYESKQGEKLYLSMWLPCAVQFILLPFI